MRRTGIILTAVAAVLLVSSASAQVVVELVPDNPGPYLGGESFTVDVWLHSEVSGDVVLDLVQFDFTDTDPAVSLDGIFTFDFSSIPNPIGGWEMDPDLPVPWIVNDLDCVCPDIFLPLAEGGSLHIGSIGLRLPSSAGVYRLDVLNADEPDEALGARIRVHASSLIWRSFNGDITGGGFEFLVTPPIPTLSEWGIVVMGLLVIGGGSLILLRRGGV